MFGTKGGSRNATARGILTYRSKQAATAADPLAPLWPQPPAEQAVWYLVNTRLEELAEVSESDVEKYGLRVGDVITLKNGRVVNPPSLGRPDYGNLTQVTAEYPNAPIWLANPALASNPVVYNTLRAIEASIVRLGYGQRFVVVATPEAGKTTVVESLADCVKTDTQTRPHIAALLVGERPEEIPLFSRRGIENFATPGDKSPLVGVQLAFVCFERVKRLMEAGRDVVLFIDSLTRLGEALQSAYKTTKAAKDDSPGAGGYYDFPTQVLKQLFMSARRLEGGGSLTIIGTALIEAGSNRGMETDASMLVGASNASLFLRGKPSPGSRSPNLTIIGYPAIDVGGSTTRKAELMRNHPIYANGDLSAGEAFQANLEYAQLLKAIATREGPEAALQRLLSDIRTHPTNMEMYQQGAQEQRTRQAQELKQPLNELMDAIQHTDEDSLINWLWGRFVAIAKSGGPPKVRGFIKFLEEKIQELETWLAQQDENPRRRNIRRQ